MNFLHSVKKWKRLIVIFIILIGLGGITGWWAQTKQEAKYRTRLMLYVLGRERLGLVDFEPRDPREFLISDYLQKIRSTGYDPVWRDGKYILKNLKSGREIDPFPAQLGREPFDSYDFIEDLGRYILKDTTTGKKIHFHPLKSDEELSTVDVIDLNGAWTYDILNPGSSNFPNTPDYVMPKIYSFRLAGFHLVLRKNDFLLVRRVQRDDVEVTLEQLLLRDAVISYDSYALLKGPPVYVANYEAILKRQGFIMKKKGDGYVPISLETAQLPEFPAKEVFIRHALDQINEYAAMYGSDEYTMRDLKDDYLAKRRFLHLGIGEWYPQYVASKEELDLYGVKTHWNATDKRYELLQ